MKDKKKYLYMATTRDKYELPLFVADSTRELAEMMGIPHKTVSMYMSPVNQESRQHSGFYKIEIPEDEYDEVFGDE